MKVVLISDTHGSSSDISLPIVPGDLIIHSGDFTRSRAYAEEDFYDFIEWFSSLDYKYKILVSGNHDKFIYENREAAKILLHTYGIIYLEDSSVVLEGIKFYGSPWTPTFLNWYFMKPNNKLADIYEKIDIDTQVLITHGPAYGILDITHSNIHAGCNALRYRVENLPSLKYHAFGHIHESRGKKVINGVNYINASIKHVLLDHNFFQFEIH